MSTQKLIPVCPNARVIEGATPADGGVICAVMERDAQRADPILEGAPVGVYLRMRSDPSMIREFCCGTGEPMTDPDQIVGRPMGQGHYSACPIYEAGQAVVKAEGDQQRAFKPAERPDMTPPDLPGVTFDEPSPVEVVRGA